MDRWLYLKRSVLVTTSAHRVRGVYRPAQTPLPIPGIKALSLCRDRDKIQGVQFIQEARKTLETILLVDDVEMVRELVVKILQAANFNVLHADTLAGRRRASPSSDRSP